MTSHNQVSDVKVLHFDITPRGTPRVVVAVLLKHALPLESELLTHELTTSTSGEQAHHTVPPGSVSIAEATAIVE